MEPIRKFLIFKIFQLETCSKNGKILNKNHTSFLIINDNNAREFRRKFELNLHEEYKPVILITVQGGYSLLEDILNAIERQVPILLFSVYYNLRKSF